MSPLASVNPGVWKSGDVSFRIPWKNTKYWLVLSGGYWSSEKARVLVGEKHEGTPQLLVKTTPSYTDAAIRAKVQGVVLLKGMVRRNGRVDTLSVVRSLGYGLDENAIREMASWRWRPAMRNGKAVDAWATIEVAFNLR